VRLTCALPPDGGLSLAAYAVSAAVLAAAWIGSALFLRQCALQPFVGLFAALGLCAIAYDLIVGRPLLTGVRLINDTFDVLRFLVFASFALLLTMARRWTMSVPGVALAAAASFAMTIAAMTGFHAIRHGLIGAFELYVLYIAYAFGGFTLHLMTLSLLVAAARPGSVAGGELEGLARSEAGETLAGRSGHHGGA
jgi:hypothetical protein